MDEIRRLILQGAITIPIFALLGCGKKEQIGIELITKDNEPTQEIGNIMIFNSVAKLKLAKLTSGQVVSTIGYTSLNDEGQGNYVIQTPAEFVDTPNELSDMTIANGNIAVLLKSGDAWNLKQFGAIGDDVADDALSLQAFADKGGRLYMPRGVYRTSTQINFTRFGHLYGESSGVGLGGGAWGSLLIEAEQGASIIHPIVGGFVGDKVFNFENPNEDFKPLPSIAMSDFKIITERDGAVEAHLLQVVNAYDALFMRNIALMFANKDYNALRLIEIDGLSFPSLSQTGIVENVVAIGEDDNTTSTPVCYIRRQQEMQYIGLKVFGAAQSISPATPRTPIAVENCRGLSFIGCSSAATAGIGLDIYCTDVDVDGIWVSGHTFEGCETAAWQLDGITRDTAAHTVTNVNIRGSRYQFPQTVAGIMKAATYCTADTTVKTISLSDACTNNTIYGQDINKFSDSSGIGTNNVYFANGINGFVGYGNNNNLTIVKDSATINLSTESGGFSHSIKSSKNSGGDNFGLQITDEDTGSVMTVENTGQLRLASGTASHIGIVMPDEGGVLRRLRLLANNTVEVTLA